MALIGGSFITINDVNIKKKVHEFLDKNNMKYYCKVFSSNIYYYFLGHIDLLNNPALFVNNLKDELDIDIGRPSISLDTKKEGGIEFVSGKFSLIDDIYEVYTVELLPNQKIEDFLGLLGNDFMNKNKQVVVKRQSAYNKYFDRKSFKLDFLCV